MRKSRVGSDAPPPGRSWLEGVGSIAPLRTAVRFTVAALLATLPLATGAADHLRLPRHACDASTVFDANFETLASIDSSAGSGGLLGLGLREFELPGSGTRRYHLATPAVIEGALPLLVALHGSAGAGLADAAAQSIRDRGSALAQSASLLVIAPVASGSQGGWLPSIDFAQIDAAIADASLAYPIDRSRVYLWGFSAGGHIAHTLALSRDPARYAGYAVNAGVLDAHAGSSAPALAPRRTPLSQRVGLSDSLRPLMLADHQRFLDAGWSAIDLRYADFSGGHSLSAADPDAHWDFLCRFALPP